MSRSSRYSSVYKNNYRAKRGNSRLLKKQEKEMRNQTVFFIFLAIALLLFFVFIIVPNIIKLFFNFFDEDQINVENDLPPQSPILFEAPPEATFSAQLKLEGFGDPQSTVIFVLNGNQVNEAIVNEDGQFNQLVQLNEGDNQLAIYAVNKSGTESLQTKTYQVIFDDEPPIINIIEPTPDSVIELKRNRSTTIIGETEPLSKVYLNERLILVGEDGQFSSSYYLDEGENNLKFLVIDRAGNQSELEIKVKFLNN